MPHGPNRYSQSVQLALILLSVGAVLATALPEAQGARSASMAEHRLVLDKNDVYIFPQLGVEYTNLVSFEYGFDNDQGSGLFLFGDESRYVGAGLSRGDLIGPRTYFSTHVDHRNLGVADNVLGQQLGELNDLLPGPDQLATPGVFQPGIIADLFGATEAGSGILGARLSLGHGATITRAGDEEQSAEGQTFVGATVGYTSFGDVRVDTGLTIQYSGGGIAEERDLLDASHLLAGVSGRLYTDIAEDVELGTLLDIHYNNSEFTEFDVVDGEVVTRTAELGGWTTFAGTGPVYSIDETTISAYGVLGYARQSADPDVDADGYTVANSSTVLPGIKLAADIELLEWLYFRSGMQYNYRIERTATESDNDDDPSVSRRLTGFGWRAGIGIEVNNFTVDGVFQSGFVTNGPSFLGGGMGDANDDEIGIFTMVAAGYRF